MILQPKTQNLYLIIENTRLTKLRDNLQKRTGITILKCQGHKRQSMIKGDLRDITTKYCIMFDPGKDPKMGGNIFLLL